MNLLFELGYSCLKRSNLLSVLPLFLLIFLQLLVYENSPNIIRLAVVAVIFLMGPKFEFQCQMCLYLLLLLQLCVIIFLLQRIDSLLVIHLYLGRLFPLLFDGKVFSKKLIFLSKASFYSFSIDLWYERSPCIWPISFVSSSFLVRS